MNHWGRKSGSRTVLCLLLTALVAWRTFGIPTVGAFAPGLKRTPFLPILNLLPAPSSPEPPTAPTIRLVPGKQTFSRSAVIRPAINRTTISPLQGGAVNEAAVVRNAPTVDGRVEGSIRQITGQSVNFNSGAVVTEDLLVPGIPTVQVNGTPNFGGTIVGPGATTPTGYQITLNTGATLRNLRNRIDPIALPTVSAPPAPTGTRDVTLNTPADSPGDFATLRSLTLNSGAGQRTIPAGTYGNFSANSNSGFTLGVAGATTPAVYNFQQLTLNSGSSFQVVGPIRVTLGQGISFNASAGAVGNPGWFELRVASGGVTVNSGTAGSPNVLYALVTAPSGTVTINSNSRIDGTVTSDRLQVNSQGILRFGGAPACPTVTVGPMTVPAPRVGAPYAFAFSGSGGTGPYAYSVSAGTLPAGLALTTAGVLSGTPTTAGAANFTIRATDANNCFGTRDYSVTVGAACPGVTVTPASLPVGTPGTAYNQALAATGGTAPHAFSISGGAPPPGITLSATGVLSGTPVAAGSRTFTVRATDATGCFGETEYTLRVGTCPTIAFAPPTLPNGTVGTAYNQTVTATGGTAPYAFAVVNGALPNGLQLSGAGALTGTPTTAGTQVFTLRAVDAAGCAGEREYRVTVGGCVGFALVPAHLANGTVGTAYEQSVATTGGTQPVTYAVTGGTVPLGVSFAPDGTMKGSPTAAGSWTFTVRATDATGCAATRDYTVTVGSCASLTLDPTTLPAATVNAAYTQTLRTSGATGTVVFTLAAGTLPAGLALSSAGVITGTPTTAGSRTFTVRAVDATNCAGTREYTLAVGNCAAVTLTPVALEAGTVGTAYSRQLTATGGTGAISYALAGGALPAGLSLNGTGLISGTPTANGSATFTVRATDTGGCTGTREYTLTVGSCATIALVPAALAAGFVGLAYSRTVTALGGSGTVSFAVTTGTLPAGLALATNGVLSGTPTTAGTSTFTIRATDANNCTGIREYTLTVGTCPTIALAPTTLSNGTVGTAYSQTVTASGGTAPYGFAVSAGTLPAGLNLTTAGVLSGTPTTAGNSTFTVRATDANGCAGTQNYTLIVAAACPTITLNPVTLPNALVGIAYSQTITATGGATPSAFVVSAGTLPAGVTLTAAGVLSGTPTTAGSATFTIRATDANNCAGERAYTLTVGTCPTIALAPATLPNGTVGTAYSQTVTATGGTAPYGFAVSSGTLPAGISLTVAGVLSGTPTAAGASTFAIRATDANGCSGTQNYTLIVAAACPTITVNPAALPNALFGIAYSQTITATGGATPYAFAISAGTLPAGLTLTAAGVLSGTATTAGSATFTIRATDANNCAGERAYTLTVGNCPMIALAPATLPNGTVGTTYSQTVTATGGNAPYIYAVSAGTLPAGLTLVTGGTLSGNPATAGNSTFTIRATDAAGCSSTREYTLTISAACPTITVNPATLPNALVGIAYSQAISATGGATPYAFAISAGTLPAGLTLTAAGVLSGTTTTAGSTTFTIRATDANNCTGTREYTLTVGNCPTISLAPATLPNGTVGTTYNQTVTATGGTAPYSYSISAGTLPAGLTLSTIGALSGNPTTAGSSIFTVRATDAAGCSGTREYTVTISTACPTITVNPATLPNPLVGIAYSQTITATGGATPYAFAISAGTLPVGLTLNATTGVLSGTATTAGSATFTIRATDANNCTGTREYTLTVGNCPTISLAPATLPNGTVGTAYSQTVTATGGVAPYTYAVSAGTLPAGLTLATGGVLSGNPTTAGSSTFTVRATDANECAGTREYTLTIAAACPTITVNPATLPNALVGIGYSQAISATGGATPYAFVVSAGTLPAGLTLSTAGVLSGTVTTVGSATFTIRATDANNCTGTREYTLTVGNCPTISLAPATLLNGTVGTAYSQTVTASGGTAPYTFTLSAGTLPAGLTLTTVGVLSGTPTTAGNSTFTIRVTDAAGCFGTREYTVTISAACPTITVNPATLPNPLVGISYSQTITATGGATPYAFAISAGTLPAGLTLTAAGVLSGTTTTAGSTTFTIRATDTSNCTGTREYTLTVGTCPTITIAPTTLPNGTVGTAYSQTVTASGGTAPYAFTVSAGTLPAGLTLTTVGVLSGTPTTAGNSTFTIRVTDAAGCSSTREYTVTISAACPTITVNPATLPNPLVGISYSQTITATGGATPYAFAVSAGILPAGLTLTAAGVLSGTTTTASSATFTIRATDANDCTGTREYTLTVGNCPTIALAPATLPNGTVGTAYSQTVTATGGTAPYSYSISAGTLPAGLTLATGGALSGNPTTAGNSTFTIRVTDAAGCSSTREYTVTISAACPTITVNPATLPNPLVGIAYSQTIIATGGATPYAFAVSAGTLPVGLTLTAAGVLSGTAAAVGSSTFTIRATDANNCTGTREYTLTVGSCPTIVLAPTTLPNGAVGTAYSQTVTATGGTAPYSYSISAGTLPAGVTLATGGVISGNPTTAGNSTFTIRATDAAGCSGTREYTVTISAACPTITVNPATLPNPLVGIAYSQTITATGGTTPYAFVVSAGTLPAGLTLTAAGVLSGTATTAGSATFTIRATDANNCTEIREYTLTVGTCPTIALAPATLPNGTVGTSYSQTVTASGGTAPYSFIVSSGTLPVGITLTTAGVLSGTPTTAGNSTYTVRATDANGCAGTREYTLTIAAACPTITVNPATLPNPLIGIAYSQTITATGGATPYVFAVSAGTLPAGLTLTAAGVLSGTATTAGSTTFTIRVTDANNCTGERSYTLTVANCPTITVTPAVLPNGRPATAYSQTLAGNGGTAPYSFALTSGTLPTGLSLSPAGVVSGTPTANGSSTFTLRATDSNGCSGSRAYTLVVSNTAGNRPPIVDAGPDQPLTLPATITLFGGAIDDGLPTGGSLTFAWSQVSGPGTTTFTPPTTPVTTAAFSAAGTYVLRLTANDTELTAFDDVTVTVAAVNQPPIVSAGPNRTVRLGTNLLMNPGNDLPLVNGNVRGWTEVVGTGWTQPYPETDFFPTAFDGRSYFYAGQTGSGELRQDVDVTRFADRIAAGTQQFEFVGWIRSAPEALPDRARIVVEYRNADNTAVLATYDSGAIAWPSAWRKLADIRTAPVGTRWVRVRLLSTMGSGPNNEGFFDGLVLRAIDSPLRTVAVGLDGTVTDDGLPNNTLTAVWTGPAGGAFTPATSAGTLASFTEPGNYTLTLTGSDSQLSASATVTVTVEPAPSVQNQPPTVDAGPSQVVSTSTVTLTGTVTDDGLVTAPPTVTWRIVDATCRATLSNPNSLTPTLVLSGPGTVVVEFVASDGEFIVADRTTVTFGGPDNLPPTVSAGADQTLPSVTSTASLAGTVADDGKPTGGQVVVAWRKVSGPGRVTFANQTSATTTATFRGPGQYVLRLTASDGDLTVSDDVTIVVTRDNQPPEVGAGPDLTVEYPNGVTLQGSVIDDGLPVTATAAWSLVTGPGTAAFSPPTAATTSVTFSRPGVYTLRLTGSDTAFTLADDVQVTVVPPATCPTLNLVPDTLRFGRTFPVDVQLAVTGGSGPFQFAAVAGTLPTGVTLNAAGRLQGTPSVAGTFRFTVEAINGEGCIARRDYEVPVVNCPAVTLAPTTLPNPTVGIIYSQTLAASGGATPYLYSVATGTLPAGLTLTAGTGVLSGTPTASGNFTFTLRATDTNGCVGERAFTMAVGVCPTIALSPATLPNATVGTAYSQTLSASGGTSPYAFSLAAGTLPAGLTLAAGALSGTPAAGGNFTFTVRATDAIGCAGERAYTMTVTGCPTIALTPATLPNATVGTAYSQTIAASGGAAPYAIVIATGTLPAGLTLATGTGVLSGTPTAGGNFAFTVRATDAGGCVGERAYSLAVGGGCPTITLSPTTLPNAVVNTPYSRTIVATGGAAPYAFSITGGTLPTGLALTAGGVLSGTPTAAGNSTFTVRALDANNCFVELGYTLAVGNCPAISVTPATLPNPSVGTAYSQTVGATGGAIPYAFAVSAGTLPAGLTLSTGGVFSGTPTTAGNSTFTVRAVDANGCAGERAYTVTVGIGCPTIALSPATLQNATVGTAYSQTIAASGGAALYTFAIATGALPAGLTLAAGTGVVSGTPTTGGNFAFTVRATDAGGCFGERAYTLTVGAGCPGVALAPATLPPGRGGVAYNQTIAATGGTSPYTFTVSAGGLPAGLTLSSGGVLAGTPTVIGSFQFTVQALDASGCSGTRPYTLTIENCPTITIGPPAIPAGTVGTPYTLTFTASGGAAPYTFAISGLPPGLTLAPTGAVTGTPPTPGSFPFTLTVTDANGCTGAAAGAIDIAGNTTLVARIATPIDGATVTAPTQVTGTATGGTSWRLEIAEGGEDGAASLVWTQIGTGTTDVTNGPLGTIDPTLLNNGVFTLRLTVASGPTSVATTSSVVIDGQMKIGIFSLAFSDVSVPMLGLPVEVVRTYDSRDRGRIGDFGFGWRVGIRNVKVEKTVVPGRFWDMQVRTQVVGPTAFPIYSLVPSRAGIVTVTFQNRKALRFRTVVSPAQQQNAPPQNVIISFAPEPGTNATLKAIPELAGPGEANARVVGTPPEWSTQPDWFASAPVEVVGIDNTALPFNPTRFELFDEESQLTYVIDQFAGVQSVRDPNGNTLTVSAAGITHSAGKSLTFTRDVQGRITRVTDPAGNQVQYVYDANGDLASVTDRENNVTRLEYQTTPTVTHYLTRIVDPRPGFQGMRTEYDASGRMVRQIDGNNAAIVFTHDIPGRTEVVRDRLGNPTTLVYDDRGNITRRTDAEGGVTEMTYDDRDNMLTERRFLNATTSYTTTYTYDARNNRLSITDPLGNVTRMTYNSRRQVLSITDPRGNVVSETYDSFGNLLTITNTDGKTKTYFYTFGGLIASMRDALGNSTVYQYDGNGNVVRETDPEGGVTNSTYDANNNLLTKSVIRTVNGQQEVLTTQYLYDRENRVRQITLSDGAVRLTTYNQIGKVATTIDALLRTTTLTYDGNGRLIRTNYPDSTFDESSYDAEDRVVLRRDRTGRVTSFIYDRMGRLVETRYSPGSGFSFTSVKTTYDLLGRMTLITDERGNQTTYEYDPNCGCSDRQTAIRDALGRTATFAYDANGNQVAMTDARGNATTYTYDRLNRRTRTTFHDGTSVETTYDDVGRRISERDQDNRATQFRYDKVGRLTSVLDALQQETKYGYNEIGQQIAQIDAKQQTTRYEYDRMGRRTRQTLPEGQSETYAYDLNGNLTSRTDFNGRTFTYSYDTMNRLTSKSSPGFSVSYSYTATGRRASMTDASGTTSYTYDARDRLLSKATPQGTLSYTYDLAGNLLTTRSSNAGGTQVDYRYDALNRMDRATDLRLGATNNATNYAFDEVGNLRTVTLPNGVATTYTYNTLNRLTNVGTVRGTTNVAGYVYTLGPAGNRLSVAELGGRTVNYTYDNLYRLTSETVTGTTNPSPNGTVSYTYDQVGNRLSRTSTLPGVPSVASYSYDRNDRLSSDNWDNNGNTVSSNGRTYQYDAENRIASATGGGLPNVTVVYDGDGNRVAKTVNGVTTRYLVDDNNHTGYAQVVEELQNGAVTRQYTYGHDLISQRQQIGFSTVVSFYGYDGHGSVRYLTDAGGAVTDRYDYDAFGSLITQVGTTPNLYLYAGEQWDPDLGLYFNRARYLNVGTGRFHTMDSWQGLIFDPLSLHKYLYAHNSPIEFIDPSGFQVEPPLLGTIVGNLIGADFYMGDPDNRDSNKSIHTILKRRGVLRRRGFWSKLPALFLGLSRPDLIHYGTPGGYTNPLAIYEIKTVRDFKEGLDDIAFYLLLLNAWDPGWVQGDEYLYTPIRTLIVPSPLAVYYVKVNSPKQGVITYDYYDLTALILSGMALVAVYNGIRIALATRSTVRPSYGGNIRLPSYQF